MSAVRHIPKSREPFDAERECLALRSEVQALRADFDAMRELLMQVRSGLIQSAEAIRPMPERKKSSR